MTQDLEVSHSLSPCASARVAMLLSSRKARKSSAFPWPPNPRRQASPSMTVVPLFLHTPGNLLSLASTDPGSVLGDG
jgi:hypothetical protein